MSALEPRRAELVAVEPAPSAVELARPLVVDGELTRIIEIAEYPEALTSANGCTSFEGTYVVDPTEIAAIHLRVGRGR